MRTSLLLNAHSPVTSSPGLITPSHSSSYEHRIPVYSCATLDKNEEEDKVRYFHGMGYDLTRLESILRVGILSAQSARHFQHHLRKSAESGRRPGDKHGGVEGVVGFSQNHENGGYNQHKYISVALDPFIDDNDAGSDTGLGMGSTRRFPAAYQTYIEESISVSFMLHAPVRRQPLQEQRGGSGGDDDNDDKNDDQEKVVYPEGENWSGFVDEMHVKDYIDARRILGVHVPEEVAEKRVSELRLGLGDMTQGMARQRVEKVLEYLRIVHGYPVPESDPLIRQYLSGDDSDVKEVDRVVMEHMERAYGNVVGGGEVKLKRVVEYLAWQTSKCVSYTEPAPIHQSYGTDLRHILGDLDYDYD